MPRTKHKKRSTGRKKTPTTKSAHHTRFPNETSAYRKARDRLLKQEIDLRRRVEAVAAARRKLRPGGEVPEDYVFEEQADLTGTRRVRLSELFAPGRDTLILYNYMYGPKMERPCPMCTSIVDSLDGASTHVNQRANIAIVARSPLPRILAFARERGWRHLRFLSSSDNNYNRDYLGEDADGRQWPMLNVFVKRNGRVRHFWGSELAFAKADKGQSPRHVDMIWPLWNLFDLTPEGRGSDWHPRLAY
ncbi:MAG: DUF899 family protein [Gammaproteobacteria bacterium]|nr:DUF899 family protein [Gammaproteobacteria bacterium]MDE2345503.1 DUF899 family protein [Gammaproteobacteria bacterium]